MSPAEVAAAGGALPPGVGPLGAVEVVVTGLVQGVGFRPFVHRLAARHQLAGWVRNESGAVRIRAEGATDAIERFLQGLSAEAPALARLDDVSAIPVGGGSLSSFVVAPSETFAQGRLPVSPDVATCGACEAELRDPTNRRYRYPFITCTDCGPRFTVIERMPYDRERTTMRSFVQCPVCAGEYGDPADRRFHSETNSCPSCGPTVWMEVPTPSRPASAPTTLETSGQAAIEVGATLLRCGAILAVRGLGGFHLAVRADDDDAVALLRRRKARHAKPVAVMVANLDAARRIAVVPVHAEKLLESPERPIVVLERRPGGLLSRHVSPGLDTVGVFLAYTPLHHLLLEAVGDVPLVMTSGNVSDEPIAISNEEARAGLSAIAHGLLLHDREIVARYDDSVVRWDGRTPIMLRRSRGFAPMPLRLPVPVKEGILAVGPHLKNTFTLAQGDDAFVSQHVGDLGNLETLRHFQDAEARFRTLFGIRPSWVVRDMHPGYLSTALAQESGLPELPPVQHHHAHVAAVAAEHGETAPVLGLAFDGTGYGEDGHVWGCEMLLADLVGYDRLAHLRCAPLPGGDRGARTPWRALLGYASLEEAADGLEWIAPALVGVDGVEVKAARRQVERGLNAPLCSSLGRLFDAAAAIVGIRSVSRYEGQAAMELEAAARRHDGVVLPFPVVIDPDGGRVLDPVPLLRALAERRRAGRSPAECAADFHETVAHAAARLAVELCGATGTATVALAGGCFQNARLLDGVTDALEEGGLRVLVPRLLSPNDGAVSYGQAVVAAARLQG